MKNLAIWIQAARPKTLIASISPVAIGSSMAMADGFFSCITFSFLLLTALGIQITTNYANDWLDFVKGSDREGRKGPLRVTQQGLVSVGEIKWMTFIVLICTLLCSLPLIWKGGVLVSGLMVLALLCALGYTGGPFPLAYLGLGDLFVLFFFGPVATCSSYFLHTHQLNWQSALMGFSPGLLSCALLTINNLRDEEEDRQNRKKTTVVRFGKLFGKWQAALCLLLPTLLPIVNYQYRFLSLLTLLSFFPALLLAIEVYKISQPIEYNFLFSKVSNLLALYTFIFCFSWML